MGVLAFSCFLKCIVRADPSSHTRSGDGPARVAGVGGRAHSRRRRALDYLILDQQIGHEIFACWTDCMA